MCKYIHICLFIYLKHLFTTVEVKIFKFKINNDYLFIELIFLKQILI